MSKLLTETTPTGPAFYHDTPGMMRGVPVTHLMSTLYHARDVAETHKRQWGRDVSARTRELRDGRGAVTVTWPWSTSLG